MSPKQAAIPQLSSVPVG